MKLHVAIWVFLRHMFDGFYGVRAGSDIELFTFIYICIWYFELRYFSIVPNAECLCEYEIKSFLVYVKTCGCSPLTLIGLFIAYLDISFVCNIVINACNQIKKPVISGTMLEKWQAWNIDLSSWHLFCRSPISTPFLFISHNIIILLSNDVSACFFVCKYYCFTLSRKNKFKVRDSKVRNNRFCQCIAVWSHFLKFKITHYIEAKFS